MKKSKSGIGLPKPHAELIEVRELEEIWLSIAADDPATATRVVRSIGAKISLLADYPRLGRRRSDILPAKRMTVEQRYLITLRNPPGHRRSTDQRS